MINLNQLLDQLQPTPEAGQKSTAGLESPQQESFLFSNILEGSKGDSKSGVLALPEGPLSLESWTEASLKELSLEQQEALLAALFTLEEGLTTQLEGVNPEKAQAQVDAFWSALEGLLEEWRNLMAQGDLLRKQLSQPLEPDVQRSVLQRLAHLSKLESEGIWDQIIHWIGRFMERGQGEVGPSSFSLVDMSGEVSLEDELQEVPKIDKGSATGKLSDEEPVLKLDEQDSGLVELEGEEEGGDLELEEAVVAATDILPKESIPKKAIEIGVNKESENQGLRLTPEPTQPVVEKGQEKNAAALQKKILEVLQSVAKRPEVGGAEKGLTLDGLEIQQGDTDNMWKRIRRWLADRLALEDTSRAQIKEASARAPDNLSKGGAVEFLKFVATLQRKGFGQPTGMEVDGMAQDEADVQVSPEVRRRLPLPSPPVLRQASYGLPALDPAALLHQYRDSSKLEIGIDSPAPEGAKRTAEGVGGSRESQENPVRSEQKGEAVLPQRDNGRWDTSFLQRFVSSTRAQFQMWADRKFVAMQIQMEPEALGKMQLKTILENGRIGVLIQVEQNSAKDLLNSHLDHLRSILEEKGLEVAGFHVEVRQQQTGGGQGFGGTKTHGPRFELEALLQDPDGDLQVESPILRGLINKVA